MQLRGKFYHLDETCPVFKHLKEGEACLFRKACDAVCNLTDGTAEYKKMRKEIDFRAFSDTWNEMENEILNQAKKVIAKLEINHDYLNAKRLKQAYGFDVAKKLSVNG